VDTDRVSIGVVQASLSAGERSVLLYDGKVIECSIDKLEDIQEGLFSYCGRVYVKESGMYTLLCDIHGNTIGGIYTPRSFKDEEVEVWPPTVFKEVDLNDDSLPF
jgi:hypothetical protein